MWNSCVRKESTAVSERISTSSQHGTKLAQLHTDIMRRQQQPDQQQGQKLSPSGGLGRSQKRLPNPRRGETAQHTVTAAALPMQRPLEPTPTIVASLVHAVAERGAAHSTLATAVGGAGDGLKRVSPTPVSDSVKTVVRQWLWTAQPTSGCTSQWGMIRRQTTQKLSRIQKRQ